MNLSARTSKRRVAAAAAVAVTAVAVPVALVASGSRAGAAEAGPFTAGDLVVYRVGDGSAPLTSAATAVFLDEYTTGGTKVQSVPLPTTTDGAQHRLTASGTSSSEGALTVSPDGSYLTATGYDAAPGTTGPAGASITTTAGSSVGRVVARVDGNASIDVTTALTDANAPAIVRTAVAASRSQYFVAGSGGPVTSVADGASTGTAVDSSGTGPFASEGPNVYSLGIAGGQLYASGANGVLVSSVGSGLPSGAATATALAGLPSYALASGFVLRDLSGAVAGLDTLYFVDQSDRAGAVEKYSYDGSTWTKKGSVAVDGASGLTSSVSGSTVHLFVSSPSTISTFDDVNAATSTLSGLATGIATAPANTAFRGIAFAPAAPNGPSAVLTSPVTGSHVTGSAGTLSAAAQVVAPAGVSSVTFAVDGGAPVSGTDAGAGHWTASVPLAGLAAPQTHDLVVTVTDAASHVGTDDRTFVLDSPASQPSPSPSVRPSTSGSPSPSTSPSPSPSIPAGVLRPGVISLVTAVKHPGFTTVSYRGAPKSKGLRAKNGKGTLTVRFYGTGLDIHLGVAKASGKVQVFIDGRKVATIDLNGAGTKDLMKKIRGLKAGVHTLKLVGAHQKSAKSKGYAITLGWLRVVL